MDRGDLREFAMERAGYVCEFPACNMAYDLQMAHLKGTAMGGSKYRDRPENVAVLCRPHHDWLDGRLAPNTRRFDNEQVLRQALHRPWKSRQ